MTDIQLIKKKKYKVILEIPETYNATIKIKTLVANTSNGSANTPLIIDGWNLDDPGRIIDGGII